MAPLQFGLIYDFRNPPPWHRPWDGLYEGLLRQIATAEQLGFDAIWVTEHHFAEDGYLPSLFPVAAAIASRTTRVRIGTNALLAALHHPLRVAEDAAVTDILSHGRLDLGLTLGFRRIESERFGLAADFSSRVARLNAVVKTLQAAYAEAHAVRPSPLQQPHPPLFVGANTRAALQALAPLGLPLLLIGGKDKLTCYRQAQIAAGLEPSGAPIQALGMFLYVAKDHRTAWETVGPHGRYVAEQDRRWSDKSLPVTDRELQRLGIVGSPEEVAARIVERICDTQPRQVCFFANPPGMDVEVATASLQLFATRVRALVEAGLEESAATKLR
jgi:alkanesulfonate monooxygenase SsuD/methylene tetrahydromethanopterin reductase-like flavin-dependent oxidoreductase (luciferase family)